MTALQMTLDLPMTPVGQSLEPASGSRVWWDAADAEAVARYRDWQATEWYPDNDGDDALEWWESPAVQAGHARLEAFVDAHADSWTCRRCCHWSSADGCVGRCSGLDPERTTRAGSMCEEFYPANAEHTGR